MTALDIANAYLDALSEADLERASSLLHDGVVVDIPMSLTGEPVPMFTFDGKAASMDYLRSIASNFSQVRFEARRPFVADDGRTVFVEAKGDLVQRGTNVRYRNVYCFKVTVVDGGITRVSEYTNPIAWGKLTGRKLG